MKNNMKQFMRTHINTHKHANFALIRYLVLVWF